MNGPKPMVGRVISDKMAKTVTVVSSHLQKNWKIDMYIRRRHKHHCHDEHNECRVGDLVEFQQHPGGKKSKIKAFLVTKIIKRSRMGTDPLIPIEMQPPTLLPERAIDPQVFLPHDVYRESVAGLFNPYIMDYVTAQQQGVAEKEKPYPKKPYTGYLHDERFNADEDVEFKRTAAEEEAKFPNKPKTINKDDNIKDFSVRHY